MAEPLHPEVHVKLTDEDGNAFVIIGRVMSAMRRANIDRSKIDQFSAEAQAGDYDNVLRTVMKWVSAS